MEPHSEGELAPEDFYEAITNGDMQLWTAIKDNEIMAILQFVPTFIEAIVSFALSLIIV